MKIEHRTDSDAVAYAAYWLGLHDPHEVVRDVRACHSPPVQLRPDMEQAHVDMYDRMRECVGLRCSDPAPCGHVLPPRPATLSTGYAGGSGYGWLGYEAGHVRFAMVLDYIRGRTVSSDAAAAMQQQQLDRAEANDDAFRAFVDA